MGLTQFWRFWIVIHDLENKLLTIAFTITGGSKSATSTMMKFFGLKAECR